MTISVGVDVGGTFTDFLLFDRSDNTFRHAKVATTLDDRARGFLDGLGALDADLGTIEWLVHGTTAGTNAVLERKGAPVGMITTRGFRDSLELGRRTRPYAYGLTGSFEPLVPRQRRLEVSERMTADGKVDTPLDEGQVREAVERLRELGAESIVVHFLHSYVNDTHEARAAEIVRSMWPDGQVVAGHEILREMREFERASTAAIHASISPVVSRYINSVSTRLADGGFASEMMIMQANGGMMASSLIGEQAIQTVMSGPAAGVLAAAAIARASRLDNIITGDMGGTSFDVALVVGGEPVVSAEKDLAYAVPIRIPMIDIHTIGAGGGSIARIDKAGMLRVGPESAGADPGPVGFGRGGTNPTITDANYLLGRLNPDRVIGGGTRAPMDEVEAALARLGEGLGLDAVGAAVAVVRVAIAELAGAIRLISIEKGHDPRDFAFMPFGGAGPLHAVEIARELGIPRVVVPRFPGLTSALGCILADVRHDLVQTVSTKLRGIDEEAITAIMTAHEASGRALLEREKVATDAVEVRHEADLLFRGQSHVLRVRVPGDTFDAAAVLDAFVAAYDARFGLTFPEMEPMLVNLRTTIIARRDPIDLAAFRPDGGSIEAAARGTRRVRFGEDWVEATVYSREDLPADASITGPAIVEQPDATLVLDPLCRATIDGVGNIVVDVNG